MSISKWNYMSGVTGRPSSQNYGTNSMAFSVGPLTFYFSYGTVIAFDEAGHERVVCENQWGTTTGKHLNAIHDRKTSGIKRIPKEEFDKKLQACLKRYNLGFTVTY